MTKPTVSVVMTTYGHEDYITEAIEGVLMQECDFDIELIIANDCSPDNTNDIIKKIIKEHPKAHLMKYFMHKKNIGMLPNFIWSLQQAKAKYIALCEGDDYWIDPYKLQKQVDFFKINDSYGAVFTDSDFLYQKNNTRIKSIDKKYKLDIPTGDVTNIILYESLYKTCTVLFKRPNFVEFFELISKHRFLLGDKPLWLYLSESMKIGYINHSTSVRRVLNFSASHHKCFQENVRFRQSSYKVSLVFAKRNNIDLDKKKYSKMYFKSLIKYAIENRMIFEALKHFKLKGIVNLPCTKSTGRL